MKRDDHFVCEAYVIGFCLEKMVTDLTFQNYKTASQI